MHVGKLLAGVRKTIVRPYLYTVYNTIIYLRRFLARVRNKVGSMEFFKLAPGSLFDAWRNTVGRGQFLKVNSVELKSFLLTLAALVHHSEIYDLAVNIQSSLFFSRSLSPEPLFAPFAPLTKQFFPTDRKNTQIRNSTATLITRARV